jgi:hypothetical protein
LLLVQQSSNTSNRGSLLVPPVFGLTGYVPEDVAATMLGIAKKTLWCYKSSRKIPYYKPEGSSMTYYKIDDLKRFQEGVKYKSSKEIESEANNYMLKIKMK